MGRPLILSAVAYLSGLVLGAGAFHFPLLILLLMIVWVFVSVYGHKNLEWSSKKLILSWSLVLFGMINLQMTSPADPVDNFSDVLTQVPVVVQGRIAEPLQHRPGRMNEVDSTLLIIDVQTVAHRGKEQKARGRIRLTVHGFIPEAEYGDQISVKTRLRPLTSFRNPGGFDYAMYLKRQDIQARGTIDRPEELKRIKSGGNPILRRIYLWREEIRLAMVRSLSADAAAILQAMIIGESGFITPAIREAFMISGTTHILSISGSHLSLVALVVFSSTLWLIRHLPAGLILRTGRMVHSRPLASMVTIPPVVFYALLAGGQIATVRSLMMILVYLGSLWLMRNHDPLNALAMASLAVTIGDPQAIYDISFQLSYGAVLAMILAVRITGKADSSLLDVAARSQSIWIKLKMVFFITVVAGLSTAPLVAFHFNQFNWVGLISNLLVTPLVGILVVPLGLISAVTVIANHSIHFPLAELHNTVILLLMNIVEAFSRLPWAELRVPSPPVIVISLWYVAAWFSFLSGSSYRNRTVMVVLCLTLTLPWIVRLGSMQQDRYLRLTFLDVGQGDAALIQFPSGRTMLIDGGVRHGNFDVGRLTLAPYLWDQSINRIDYLVMTHPQADHAGGLVYVLQKFQVGEIWTNGASKHAEFFNDFTRAASHRGFPIQTTSSASPPVDVDDAFVMVLHPGEQSAGLKDNDRSLVMKVQHGKHSVLFTGDIEARAERELLHWADLLESTVIKVPHHGSRSSIEPAFLIQVCPRIAVISAGTLNSFGHPSPETLAAYHLLGSRIYRTDRDGVVIFITDGEQLRVMTYKDWVLTPVPWKPGLLKREGKNWAKVVRRWLGSEPA
jgi:competence protein ComEC